MGVNALLARAAVRRAHVLLVEVPGRWALRARVERDLITRGWCFATAPADADVLAICGVAGPELSALAGRIFEQLPGPRVRVELPGAARVGSALDDAAAQLHDTHRLREDERSRAQSPDLSDDDSGVVHAGMDHAGMDHAGMDHAGMDHAGMDHGGMDMAPAGIALARGGGDRDGLEMDVLHVRLGPVLTHWPAGLVMRCALHGDVIAQARVSRIDTGHTPPHRDRAGSSAARHCDHVVDVLALAGWQRRAEQTRQARDALLADPADVDRAAALLAKVETAVRRSRVLRWSLRGLAIASAAELRSESLPALWAGDTYDRVLARIRHAHDTIAVPNASAVADSASVLAALSDMVRGLDVAAARLVVASLGIDTVTPGAGPDHG